MKNYVLLRQRPTSLYNQVPRNWRSIGIGLELPTLGQRVYRPTMLHVVVATETIRLTQPLAGRPKACRGRRRSGSVVNTWSRSPRNQTVLDGTPVMFETPTTCELYW